VTAGTRVELVKGEVRARYGEAFVVENQGVRVAVQPVGGSDVDAQSLADAAMSRVFASYLFLVRRM